ncbi:DHBP synthase RibB-like alpha/beta domain-containing protein [Apodospora peruviana]|uniref:Threonylcarbamoyl-AMP synthase n=1 Tax=Apodospora peruviana TaxID=516989 RepID=A0AAE0ISI7_9PEZI|nr:DHBP synthase RibB-like alpha/beta domain-containing protein [Apodospora peruviana]
MKTRISKVHQPADGFGRWATTTKPQPQDNDVYITHLSTWEVPNSNGDTMAPLVEAATHLRESDIPVAFPTETVYGLGADATRSAAVKGIYAAKGRPSDNPLIVHVCDLTMLRRFLSTTTVDGEDYDPIPAIYRPLIKRFWPGPLTILLPLPPPKEESERRLAPEVTAGLETFGCRMPASPLARTLIKLAGAPLAAPSANASTKPSPTTAQHVLDDLDGRIELILDGGSCQVGVESTVVDGLCDPPVVLRPGGISIEELRGCGGRWENVEKAYKDQAETGGKNAPRAPGMKYKHYSPKARVVLYESGQGILAENDLRQALLQLVEKKEGKTVAVIRTMKWPVAAGLKTSSGLVAQDSSTTTNGNSSGDAQSPPPFIVREGLLLLGHRERSSGITARLLDVGLGQDVKAVAHGLFAALRELDRQGADVIFVEGVSDGDDIAAAVMNRLRKAASDIRV